MQRPRLHEMPLQRHVRKAPAHLELPKLPMYSFAFIIGDEKDNEARDVFVSYLEAALDDL